MSLSPKHERGTNPGKEFAFGRLCRARICHLPYFVRLARSARQSALSRALNGRLRRPQQAPSAPVFARSAPAALRAALRAPSALTPGSYFGVFFLFFAKAVSKSANTSDFLAKPCPKVRTLFANVRQKCETFRGSGEHVSKSVNPFDVLFECVGLRQNFEPFHQNLHQKCSTTRSTKKMHFRDEFMKAECNKNGRLIFNVFALCRLWSKTANHLRPSRKM